MQLEFISAKSTFAVDGGGGRRGSLKSKRKQRGGESGQGYLYVCSVKKNCLIIQTENRGFAVLNVSRHYIKVFFY